MRKGIKTSFILKYGIFFYLTATVWYLLTVGEGVHAVVSFFKNVETEQESEVFTSTKFRYEKEFQNTLNHYGYFASLYQAEYSTAVPGLESTDILGETCNQMVPQGICVAGDYMLITAYDSGDSYRKKGERGSRKRNRSVLYVLSNQNPDSRELLTTVILPDINHVGGVTFDGKNIWIAKSTDRACSIISYEVIQQAVHSGKSSYELSEYDQDVFCGAVASFVTWYEDKLWVGTYANQISGMGVLRSYTVKKQSVEQKETFTLEKQEEIVIPGFANGVTFRKQGEKTYMAVTTSEGRYFHSRIYFYDVVEDPFTGKNLYHYYNSCVFPPMAEELVCDGENTYFLFESSATCYSTPTYRKCSYPVDRICALSTGKLFWQNQRGILKGADQKVQRSCVQIVWEQGYQERKYWQQYVS